MQDLVDHFLRGRVFAVVGASRDRAKFGNRVLRAYVRHGRTAHPVNLRGGTIEGLRAYRHLREIPEPIHGVSIVTPPDQTEVVVDEAIAAGIERVWMQPGAESAGAVERCEAAGIECIAGGPCVLVELPKHAG